MPESLTKPAAPNKGGRLGPRIAAARTDRHTIPLRVPRELWLEISAAYRKEGNLRGAGYSVNDYLVDQLRYSLDLPAYMLAHGASWFETLTPAECNLIRLGCLDLVGALVTPMHARLIPYMVAAHTEIGPKADACGLTEKLRLAPLDALLCVQKELLAHIRRGEGKNIEEKIT